MLENEQIEKNYTEFIELLKSVKRDGIDNLIEYLNSSDCKLAPASTKYHCAYAGGLVEHSLNVYRQLSDLLEFVYRDKESGVPFSKETIILVGLLHDISKVNYYTLRTKNVKKDNTWVQELVYQVRDSADRFVYGSHSQNSVYMISNFIKLTYEESLAILHHMGGVDYTEDTISTKNVSEAFEKSTLALLLHQADQQATFLLESRN